MDHMFRMSHVLSLISLTDMITGESMYWEAQAHVPLEIRIFPIFPPLYSQMPPLNLHNSISTPLLCAKPIFTKRLIRPFLYFKVFSLIKSALPTLAYILG